MSSRGEDLDSAGLSENERRAIWRVLQRDEAMKQQHEQRILWVHYSVHYVFLHHLMNAHTLVTTVENTYGKFHFANFNFFFNFKGTPGFKNKLILNLF